MKPPIRYNSTKVVGEYGDHARLQQRLHLSPDQNGKWVKWKDYSDLEYENEQLRKAGNAMYEYITAVILEGRISSPYLNRLQDDWDNAAKEGKPSV